MNLLSVVIALYSFIVLNPQIPQSVKDDALVVVAQAFVGQNTVTETPKVSAPVMDTVNTKTVISGSVMAVPEQPASSYAIGDKKCIVNRSAYGINAPQAVYEVTPSTGFTRAEIRGDVLSTNDRISSYNTSWTPYSTPKSSPWYDSKLSEVNASINGLEENDVITYTVHLFNYDKEVNSFDGRLQFHTCN